MICSSGSRRSISFESNLITQSDGVHQFDGVELLVYLVWVLFLLIVFGLIDFILKDEMKSINSSIMTAGLHDRRSTGSRIVVVVITIR